MRVLILFIAIVLTYTDQTMAQEKEYFKYSENGELINIPSSTSSKDDFNFLIGNWTVQNRKLITRLKNSNDWNEFEAKWKINPILDRLGNIENYYATLGDKPFEGVALRFFDQKTKLWSIYWSDINSTGILQAPITGSFYGDLGIFYMKDRFNNKEILVKYEWDKSDLNHPTWRQGVSLDDGKTWEWNWYMTGTKVEE